MLTLEVYGVRFLQCLLCLLIACLILPAAPALAAGRPNVSAQAAILIEQQSGRVLYALNEKEKLGEASTTKVVLT